MSATDGLKDGVTLQDVLEATYGDMSTEFQNRIEGVLDEAHLASFGEALFNYAPGPNEFLSSLINRIGMVNVNYQSFKSPLAMFKKGMLEFGDTIEDIYIEPVKGMLYEAEVPNSNPGDQFKTFKPDVDVVFYKRNRELAYPLTVNQKVYKRAFTSYREMDKFLSGLMQQLTNADEIDDFGLTLKLLSSYGNVDGKNLYYQVHVNAVEDETTAKELVTAVRSLVPTMKFPSRKFNSKGVLNWAKPDDMYLLVTPQTNAILDVDVLAKAYNMDKTTFMGHVVEVPDFGGLENTQALLVHKEFFQIWDTLRQATSTGLNALHLTINYFYHHHGILAVSPFYPAIQFTTATVSPVSEVAITGSDTISLGDTQNYVANVTGGATGAVIWSVVDEPQYVSINQNGNLTVGASFSGSTVTIKATSVEDSTKSATKEITIV